MTHRRPLALVTGAVLVLEAVGFLALHWVLGVMADRQKMSLAGLDPRAIAVSAWTGGALLGAFLLLCGALSLRTALTDRPPGRFTRTLLVCAAVLHGVLGAVAVGLVGWPAFGVLMAVLGLVVLTLLAHGPGTGTGPGFRTGPGPGSAGTEPPLRPTTP